jgi:hypothetical protein
MAFLAFMNGFVIYADRAPVGDNRAPGVKQFIGDAMLPEQKKILKSPSA